MLVTTHDKADRAALRRAAKSAGAPERLAPDTILKVGEVPLLGTGKTDYAAVQALVAGELSAEAAGAEQRQPATSPSRPHRGA